MPDFNIYPSQQDYTPFSSFGDNTSPVTTLLQLALQTMTSGRGFAMMGVNDRNLFDRMEHQRMTFRHMDMLKEAAKMDQVNAERAIQGVFQSFGVSYGDAQREGAQFYAKFAPTILPFLAQVAPEQLDAAFGRRGSSTVFGHFAET